MAESKNEEIKESKLKGVYFLSDDGMPYFGEGLEGEPSALDTGSSIAAINALTQNVNEILKKVSLDKPVVHFHLTEKENLDVYPTDLGNLITQAKGGYSAAGIKTIVDNINEFATEEIKKDLVVGECTKLSNKIGQLVSKGLDSEEKAQLPRKEYPLMLGIASGDKFVFKTYHNKLGPGESQTIASTALGMLGLAESKGYSGEVSVDFGDYQIRPKKFEHGISFGVYSSNKPDNYSSDDVDEDLELIKNFDGTDQGVLKLKQNQWQSSAPTVPHAPPKDLSFKFYKAGLKKPGEIASSKEKFDERKKGTTEYQKKAEEMKKKKVKYEG